MPSLSGELGDGATDFRVDELCSVEDLTIALELMRQALSILDANSLDLAAINLNQSMEMLREEIRVVNGVRCS